MKSIRLSKMLAVSLTVCGLGLAQKPATAQLNQVNKAKQSEAKQYAGTLVRAQQAYYLENEKFANKIDDLGEIALPRNQNYSYTIALVSDRQVQIFATSKRPILKSYTGSVFISSIKNETITLAILCEATKPGPTNAPAPRLIKGEPQCSPGTKALR
jgi:type IV pilus assembly protein PilA